MSERGVVVVDGGAAGLSGSYALQEQGFSLILLEAGDRVGGRLAGDTVDGFPLIRRRTSSAPPTMSPSASARSWNCPWWPSSVNTHVYNPHGCPDPLDR